MTLNIYVWGAEQDIIHSGPLTYTHSPSTCIHCISTRIYRYMHFTFQHIHVFPLQINRFSSIFLMSQSSIRYIVRIVNLSVLSFLCFLTPAGSPDPGGLPDLECEECFGQWVLKPAFPGLYIHILYDSCTPCISVIIIFHVFLSMFVCLSWSRCAT